jgi:hypothetical protein
MRRRSAILTTAAAALLIADGFWAYGRYFRPNAAVTYIGLDSVTINVSASARAPQLRHGKWDIDPSRTLQSRFYDPPPGQKRLEIALVSFGPQPQFGQAIAVIRDLKARKVCHIALRDSATVTPVKLDFGNGPETSLDVPTIVLCGAAYGDAVVLAGPLPRDRAIHIDVKD